MKTIITAITLVLTASLKAQQAAPHRTFTGRDDQPVITNRLSVTESEAPADRDYVKIRRGENPDGSGGTPADVKGFSAMLPEITEPGFPDTPRFYQKEVNVLGIPIQGSQKVSDAALRRAAEVIYTMLANDDVRKRMIHNKARVTILAESESLTDMPERAHLKGKTGDTGRDYDHDLRGLGGIKRNPVATASEDNLLHLESDHKKQANVLVHEFGHSVMNLGLDDGQLRKVEDCYKEAMARGLWKDAYASRNAGEYFAVSTQCYFDSPKQNAAGISTRKSLKDYDPAMHTLLQSIYGDRKLPDADVRR